MIKLMFGAVTIVDKWVLIAVGNANRVINSFFHEAEGTLVLRESRITRVV